MRHQIPRVLLPTIVSALVLSHVLYCLPVFGNGSDKNMQRLQKILNFALRVVSGRRKFDHISDVRDELGCPTARQLYELCSLNLLHKIRCTGEPFPLTFQPTPFFVLGPPGSPPDLSLSRVRTEAGRRHLLFGIVATAVQRSAAGGEELVAG